MAINISVIIVNWNGKKWLSNCYDSLKKQAHKNFEIILADNASSDSSVEYTKNSFPEVKVIENRENLGYALANNKAAVLARGEYLFFLNNDTKLETHCLEELIKCANNKPQVGIFAVRYLGYDGQAPEGKEGDSGMGVDIFGYPIPSRKIFYSEGAGLFIPRELFLKLRGFDSRHFMVAEDIDLCWRAQLIGYGVELVNSAIVFHEKGGTLLGSSRKAARHVTSKYRRYLTERNTLRNILKNYSLSALVLVLPMHLFFLTIEFGLFGLMGQWRTANDIYIKAIAYNAVNLFDTLRERGIIQLTRIASDVQILNKMTWHKFYKWEVFKKLGLPLIK